MESSSAAAAVTSWWMKKWISGHHSGGVTMWYLEMGACSLLHPGGLKVTLLVTKQHALGTRPQPPLQFNSWEDQHHAKPLHYTVQSLKAIPTRL